MSCRLETRWSRKVKTAVPSNLYYSDPYYSNYSFFLNMCRALNWILVCYGGDPTVTRVPYLARLPPVLKTGVCNVTILVGNCMCSCSTLVVCGMATVGQFSLGL